MKHYNKNDLCLCQSPTGDKFDVTKVKIDDTNDQQFDKFMENISKSLKWKKSLKSSNNQEPKQVNFIRFCMQTL